MSGILTNPYTFATGGAVDPYFAPWFPVDRTLGGTDVGSITGASTGALTVNVPLRSQVGDILVLLLETTNGQGITISSPTGWAEVPNSPVDGSDCRLTVFWKRKEASDTSATTSDSGDEQVGAMIAVRGCIETGDPWNASANCTGSQSGGNLLINGTTTTENNCLVLIAAAAGHPEVAEGWINGDVTDLASLARAGAHGTIGSVAVTSGEMPLAGTFGATTVGYVSSTGFAGWVGALLPAAVPAIAISGIGTPTSATGILTISLPERKENDILVTFLETNNQAITMSGWAEAGSSPAINSGTNPTRLTIFWKRAGASESDPTTSDSGDHQVGICIAFRNVITTGDPFDITNSDSGGVNTAISIVGATTTVNKCLAILAASTTRDLSSTDTTFSGWTNSDLSLFAEIVDRVGSTAAGGGFGVAVGYKDTAGAYGTTSVTQATSVEYTTWTGALKPA